MCASEQTNILLNKCRQDVRGLESLIDNAAMSDENFGFLAQQIVEKSVKAYLSYNRIPFPFTHDIEKLLRLMQSLDRTLAEEYSDLIDLNDFAVQYRYSPYDPQDIPVDRAAMFQRVSQFFAQIEARIISTSR
jgi:HEPN domain-containing protein